MKNWHLPCILIPGVILALATSTAALGFAPEPGTYLPPSSEPAPGRVIFQLTEEAFSSGEFRPELLPQGRTGLPAVDLRLSEAAVRELAAVFDTGSNPEAKREAGLDRIFVARYDADRSPESVAASLGAIAGIEYAEPDGVWHILHAPNDPLYPDQWAHDNQGQAIDYYGNRVGTPDCDTDTDLAWDLQTGDPNLIVAIIDTGCDLNHPEYNSRLVQGYDFANNDSNPSDDNGHGTACAGIAVAAGDNAQGIAGVAWRVKLMPIKVLNANGGGTWTAVANGIVFGADNGARILSLSLGGGPSGTVENAVNYAFGQGCALFAASGNSGDSSLIYPARYSNTIAVGALSPCCERKTQSSCDRENWWASNYGTGLDFIAPGVRIHTTDRLGGAGYGPGDYISFFNGTSSATPHAAGIGALVWSQDPSLSNTELRSVLQSTCDDLGATGYDLQTGWGKPNAYAAVMSVTALEEGACCFPDGSCAQAFEDDCSTGDWRVGEPCDPNPCPLPMGACCQPDGTCLQVQEDDCSTGDWRGGSPCNPNPCMPSWGACCYEDGTCEFVYEVGCPTGDWRGGEPCDPNPCFSASADDAADLPASVLLYRNIPNPFRAATTIGYALPEPARVSLRVYDISGNLVRNLVDGAIKSAGTHQAAWDGTDDAGRKVGSGIYFYSFETGEKRESRSLILIR